MKVSKMFNNFKSYRDISITEAEGFCHESNTRLAVPSNAYEANKLREWLWPDPDNTTVRRRGGIL